MKMPKFPKSRQKDGSLKSKLLTIEALIFIVPALIIAYIFYVNNVFLKMSQALVIALTLLLILGGLMTLRQIFDKLLLFSDLVKKVEGNEGDLSDIHKETAELHEISITFSALMDKLEITATELKRRVFELFTLKELTEIASKTLNMELLLKVLLEKAMAITKAQIGSVFIVEHEKNRLRAVAAKGLVPGPEMNSYIKMNNSLLKCVVSGKEPLIVQDIENDPRTRKMNDPRYGSPSFMSMPIMMRENVIAVLSLAHKETGEIFGARDEQILSIMIGEIAFALENARLHSTLEGHAKNLEKQKKELTMTNKKLEREIVERRRAEEALRRSEKEWKDTFDAMSDWITLMDPEGHILRSNRAGGEFVEGPAEGMTHRKCCSLIHGSTETWPGCPREKMLGSGRRETAELQTPGGGQWYMVTVDPVRDHDGNIAGAVHIVQDITKRKSMEDDLLKAQKLESIGLLAGGIAHDFNNILMAVMGGIDLAKMHTKPQEKVHQLLEKMEEASLRAKDLTQQFITFSKGGEPFKRPGPLVRVIEEAVGLTLAGANVKAEFSLSPLLRPVEFDEAQIRQAISNVISNAVQAVPEGGTVKVRAENREVGPEDDLPLKEGRYVEIAIEDQGVGIPRENIPLVFDPYFSTVERGSRKGIGLGLSTAYSIIKRHDGHIQVNSEVGIGTTVTIYLPSSIGQDPKGPDGFSEPAFDKARVLVMDDEDLIRDISGEMLNCLGFDVEVAQDGGEAITKYREALESGEPFDVVILDLTVPGGMGGKEATRELREIDSDVVTIATSGYSDDPVMTDFSGHGFDGALAKPYEFGKLHEVLHRAMNKMDG